MAGVTIRGAMAARYDEILTKDALDFVVSLQRAFNGRRKELLAARAERQKRFDAGELPVFLQKPPRSVRATGALHPFRMTCSIAAWKSQALSIARW